MIDSVKSSTNTRSNSDFLSLAIEEISQVLDMTDYSWQSNYKGGWVDALLELKKRIVALKQQKEFSENA
jgi:hypothetical protein